MTIEILYLTTQMQRWINLRVARHLEAQASRLKPLKGSVVLGAEGPGGAVRLDLNGMPAGVDETESFDISGGAGGAYPAPQLTLRDSEKQTVHA
jgi:hypothetical protein